MSETSIQQKPAIESLLAIIKDADPFETSVTIRNQNGDEFKLLVTADRWFITVFALPASAAYRNAAMQKTTPNEELSFLQRTYRAARPGKSWFSPSETEYTLSEAMTQIATGLPDAKLLINTIKIKAKGSSLKGPGLKQLAIAAWCEAKGIPLPTSKEVKAEKEDSKNLAADKRNKTVNQLRSGAAGIKEWNALSQESKSNFDLQNLDLSGADLTNINLSSLNISGSNFSGANLTGAKFDNTQALECNFNDAVFQNCNLEYFRGAHSTFINAVFKQAKGRLTSFNEANLTNAQFENCELEFSHLQGADLTGATFKNCDLTELAFDVNTRLPDDFAYPDDLNFVGQGIDPRKLKEFNELHAADGLDFETFLERLGQALDKDRLKKAITMLKKERFELFSEVYDESVVGIVKSQTDPNLFYSCHLTSDGHFWCCTQNLNVCGGLRGAICKHILVLILGLTKATHLDPSKADSWALASTKNQASKLDKDLASQTFLKYKGAEAGEIDWRPMETMPEDYYAF